jgi:hypothetical protein
MKIELIKPQTQTPLIIQWKAFQQQLGRYNGPLDDWYDTPFIQVIQEYQKEKNLLVDGYIGTNTWYAAYQEGMNFTPDQKKSFPLPPNFGPIRTTQEVIDLFGEIQFTPNSIAQNPEQIVITNNFATENIIAVDIPQLKKIPQGATSTIYFHRKGAEQLRGFFDAIEQKGLLPLLLSYGGSYVPRLIRGSKTTLSNHAYGTAFDLNMQWNSLNTDPAPLGALGSVRELVPLAYQYGFYWGGHFKRKDGMHFELAQIH